tara:strand:+ start:4733 stop:4951 length:219 start_codon:yes stop_codon:yes gene_type:complete
VSNQHPIDQLLTGWIEDGEPQSLEPYLDDFGQKYYPSKYATQKHKGWYWNEELKGYQRWQDMMDWYEAQGNT